MPVSQMPEQISAKSDPALISFTEQDLALFSDASGDRNPLHLSEEYARGTPYGQRVVFGCLGAMACLGQIRLPAGWSVTSLDARFHLPIFLGVQYRVETTRNVDRWEGRLFDGSTVVLSLRMTAKLFKTTEIPNQARPACAFQRRDAAVRPQDSIVPGLKVSGTYGCNPAALATLSERWGVRDGYLPAVLSWGSYLVGMELPGESALFSRFVLRFHGTAPSFAAAAYGASVSSVERGFGLVEAQVCLLDGASTVASGQCWSYIRSPVPEVEKINSSGVRPDSLAGRVAVILGSSRGLGAAIGRAVKFRGASVFGMARSGNPGEPSGIEAGDAADPLALRRLRERVSGEHGRLDFLVCNACPPVLPLFLEPNAAERIGAYIERAVSLTLAPLTEFLELLNRSGGCAVIISSVYVEHPVKEFPHYIAAKRAVEALASIASMQCPRVATLIVRPPKLLTAMTNTPIGRLGALSPGLFANRIATRLERPLDPGKTEILDFPCETRPIR
jgi:NAD(P)-dependent dehydrogenase (short-subunit alcohol dehydrogenase family)/acyl dehydratase